MSDSMVFVRSSKVTFSTFWVIRSAALGYELSATVAPSTMFTSMLVNRE